MRTKKSGSGKSAKKSVKKAERKELQSGLTTKFLEVVDALGHDAERILKDIKKISKQLALKLSEKAEKSKKADKRISGKKLAADKAEIKPLKKATARARAEKVVAKVVARKPRSLKATAATVLTTVPEKRKVKPAIAKSVGVKKADTTTTTSEETAKPVSRRGRKPGVTPVAKKIVAKRGPRNSAELPADKPADSNSTETDSSS